MIGLAVLHGHADRLFKRDRAFSMPAIEAIPSPYPLRVHHVGRAMVHVGERLAAKAPRPVVVVFGSSAVNRGQRISIDEDHVVALTEPTVLVLLDGMGYSQKMSLARCLQKDVIALAA